MNQDIFEGKWNQLKGKLQQHWGMLTDDDLDRISGQRDEVLGVIQERYGWERARAESELDSFLDNLD